MFWLVALALGTPAVADASNIVIRTSALQRTLNGSKFRHVGVFNSALARELANCGAPVPKEVTNTPGKLSATTAAAIRRLRSCPGWRIEGETASGDITEALWRKLIPSVPVPDAFGRMFIATLTLEGTDYDRLEWNYSKADPTAWATWGPYGATVGQSAEIQTILSAVENSSPGLVEDAFRRAAQDTADIHQTPSAAGRSLYCAKTPAGPADDYALFRAMIPLRQEAAGRLMRVAFCNDRRFATWVRAFRFLGEQPAVRQAYDAHYLGPSGKVARYLATTRRGYASGDATATEIDLAMGMDGQTQLTPRANVAAIAKAVRSAGPRSMPVARRIAISEALPAPEANRRDRCGRDQVFIRGSNASRPPQPVCTGVTRRKGEPPRPWDADEAWRGRAMFTAQDTGLREVDGNAVKAEWNFDFDRHAIS